MTLNQDEILMLEQAKAETEAARLQSQQLQNQNVTQAQFMEEQDKGMAESQLDLSEELERIEHLLRGHIIKKDKETQLEYWDEPTAEQDNMRLLNEYGVRLIMQILNMYLSKRKLLANYGEDEINWKMKKFAIELADLIFTKDREMGLDTPDKRKCYSMLVMEIKDAVHDIYSRALGGKERDSIRKRWNLNEQIGNNLNNMNQQGGRTSGIKSFLR